jgi:hypothetical protein
LSKEPLDPKYDMDIAGLRPASVLSALYNAARPVGMGFLQATNAAMNEKEAEELLAASESGWFDYVHGRPLKIRIAEGVLYRYDLYDRDQGRGAAARVISELKKQEATK